MKRLEVLLLAIILAPGCLCGLVRPWIRYPMATPPDSACFQSGTHGYQVFRWNCVDGHHIVISQYSAEMSANLPEKETVPCGSLSEVEQWVQSSGIPCAPLNAHAEWNPP